MSTQLRTKSMLQIHARDPLFWVALVVGVVSTCGCVWMLVTAWQAGTLR